MTRNENQGQQCLCGCRAWTTRNYAPGHDARHVATLVRRTLTAWTDQYPMYETEQAWKLALRVLPTEALRNKYRRRMYTLARSKDMRPVVAQMDDSEWQSMLRPTRDIHAVDPDATLGMNSASSWWTAIVATAMGMSRSDLNRRHS